MRVTRFYHPLPLASGVMAELVPAAAHHALSVLRLRPGHVLQLFDGAGREHAAVLERIEGRRAWARVGDALPPLPESPLSVRLAQGICGNDKMDFTLQKCVELGVAAIQPIRAARSVVRLDDQRAARRVEHWQAVVAGACEQCGRAVVPRVEAPLGLMQWLRQPAQATLRLMLSPDAEHRLIDLPAPAGAVDILVGPEGGLDEEERRLARDAGFLPVRLGPRILRTETAGLAALTLMQARWGDLQA